MNRFVTADNLLKTFPSALADDEMQLALASVTATELVELYEDNDVLALYARIDKLEAPLLDILAYDFKVDWWNEHYSVDEKRKIFKNCWNIKRKLGTASATSLAISDLFQDAAIKEWWEYGGIPFYFKVHVDSGGKFADYNKLEKIIDGIQYYKNKRSIMESIDIDSEKTSNVYVGVVLQSGVGASLSVEGINIDDYAVLADENGEFLLDEDGQVLLD